MSKLYSVERRNEILARQIPEPRTAQEIEAKLVEMMNGEKRETKSNPNPSLWEEKQREERSMFQAGLCYALGYSQLDYLERQLAKAEAAREDRRAYSPRA
jgi:hypothetical protein